MIMTLDIPDHVAYYFNDVMCPILKKSKQENDDFAQIFEVEFEKCINDFPNIKDERDD